MKKNNTTKRSRAYIKHQIQLLTGEDKQYYDEAVIGLTDFAISDPQLYEYLALGREMWEWAYEKLERWKEEQQKEKGPMYGKSSALLEW